MDNYVTGTTIKRLRENRGMTQAELADQIGVGERTVRRSLKQLHDDGLVWWRKAAYKASNRYFLHEAITDALRNQ